MAIKLTLIGRVHGVFFRSFVEKNANELGLKGYVKNKSDGTLEIIAEGPDEKLDEMIKRCRKGPESAKVEDISIEKQEDKRFKNFEIRY